MSSRVPVPRYLLAIDPGLRAVGWALFRGSDLVAAGAVRGPKTGRGPALWSAYALGVRDVLLPYTPASAGTVVVETMRHDAHRPVPVDDLLEVQATGAAIAGCLAGLGWRAEGASAHVWKGQVPRRIFGARVQADLQASGEFVKVVRPGQATELNDAMHAVGLGRWWLERQPR